MTEVRNIRRGDHPLVAKTKRYQAKGTPSGKRMAAVIERRAANWTKNKR